MPLIPYSMHSKCGAENRHNKPAPALLLRKQCPAPWQLRSIVDIKLLHKESVVAAVEFVRDSRPVPMFRRAHMLRRWQRVRREAG